MKHILRCVGLLVGLAAFTNAVLAAERGAARHLESIRDNGPELRLFLKSMPKGGDLHNHLTGAIYAENYIRWAAEDGTCANLEDPHLVWVAKDADCKAQGLGTAADVMADPELMRRFINKMSMRTYAPVDGWPGYDHFFDTFPRMNWQPHRLGDMMAEVALRADGQNTVYLELMETFLPDALGALIAKVGLRPAMGVDDIEKLHADLVAAGLDEAMRQAVADVKTRMADAEARKYALLKCEDDHLAPGCPVIIRFQQQVIRTLDPVVSYLMFALGYNLVGVDDHFVGMNLVAPEHDPRAIRYYDLHMTMMQYLAQTYKPIPIALHAGELNLGLVDTVHLKDHIRKAIEVAGATRIGHGIDIAYEDGAEGLMGLMANYGIMVEINLSSNESILGVAGDAHPVKLYRARGVPVALSTDDEGVSRIDLTHEYMRGVTDQGFSYRDLKDMSRNALRFSFLPGQALQDNAACAKDLKRRRYFGDVCLSFISGNPKAEAQFDLEMRFLDFERFYD